MSIQDDMKYEQLIIELNKLKEDNVRNEERLSKLIDELLVNKSMLSMSFSEKRTLSYQLGNLLLNSPKNLKGVKNILNGIVSLRIESLRRKKEKGIYVGELNEKFIHFFQKKNTVLSLTSNETGKIHDEKDIVRAWENIKIIGNQSDGISLGNLCAGEYEITIYFEEAEIKSNRKKLYIGLGKSNTEILSSSNLALSDKAGPFFYIGGGAYDDISGMYKQTYVLKLNKRIDNVVFTFYSTLSEMLINRLIVDDRKDVPLVSKVENRNTLNLKHEELKKIDSDFILYADININVVDGSSVWFSSMATVLSSIGKVAIILKETPRHSQILSNIVEVNKITFIDPSLLNYDGVLNARDCIEIIKEIDNHAKNLKMVVVRGIDVAYLLHSDNQFLGRTASYVTDFYSINSEGLVVDQDKLKKLRLVSEKTEFLITQTELIKNKIHELTKTKAKNINFLPALPENSRELYNVKTKIKFKKIKIGYAGKITPTWGVLELFEWVESIKVDAGVDIELYIAANKVSGATDNRAFRALINKKIKDLKVIYYNDFNREQCMKMLAEMDFIWCWRPDLLENNTLELSTKLLEGVVLGGRIINYPSNINKSTLGNNYPFYVKNYNDFLDLLSNTLSYNEYDGGEISKNIASRHNIDNLCLDFKKHVNVNVNVKNDNKNILFASHDYKFIDPYISNLKSNGCNIKRQLWDWGGYPDEAALKEQYNWADIIFCEWGLANALWYSKNNVDQKPLYVRIHAQEVRERARKFGNQMEWHNITKVIFVSKQISEQAKQLWNNLPEDKIEIIPNFILDDKITFSGNKFNNVNEIRLGILGIVPQTKRLDRAVNVLEQLRLSGKNAKLYIKGHRPESLEFMHAPSRQSELKYYYDIYERINLLNLSDHVIFEDWGNDVNEWYSKIHFILSPSDNESFHYALADGIVSGCYPILWNWRSSNDCYPFISKRVDNDDDAVHLIRNILQKNPKEINRILTSFRRRLLKVNSSNNIYRKLSLCFIKNEC